MYCSHSVCSLRTKGALFWFRAGEQLLCEASTVLKCVQEDSCQRGIYGRLVCTDFKISFLGDDESALDNDVRMSCVWLSSGERCPCSSTLSFPSFSVARPPTHTHTHSDQSPSHHWFALCPLASPFSGRTLCSFPPVPHVTLASV